MFFAHFLWVSHAMFLPVQENKPYRKYSAYACEVYLPFRMLSEHIQGLNDSGKYWILNLGFYHLIFSAEYLRYLWSITDYSVMLLNDESYLAGRVHLVTLYGNFTSWHKCLLCTKYFSHTNFPPRPVDPKQFAAHFNPCHWSASWIRMQRDLLLLFEYIN